jgi:hypothetical protein
MSNSVPIQPPSSTKLQAMLEELLTEGEQLRARAATPAPDLRALMGLPPEVGVTISRDALGLINGVTFAHSEGRRGSAAELTTQLNLALYAGGAPGISNVMGATGQTKLVDDSGELSPQVQALMAALESGRALEPEMISNDLKTVTVGALNGEIVSIEVSPSFLESASDEALEQEIVRIARQAAIATDVLGRFENRSEA